ncbi:MAG: hypothetical protein L6V93_18570 [Clostridiales bacterium]|nr:MAG: hypothetical protein L6V93_18570 [Clostridiales bacterium]
MLKINDLHVSYGGIRAIRGVSLEIPDKEIVTLIGANGAGKIDNTALGCRSCKTRFGFY